jgi:DNA-binding NarL/FixJ family response regulator
MNKTSCTIRIVVADDHTLFREGLKAVLKTDPVFKVVGEAADGIQAIETVNKLKPDVLLLDLRIHGLHGIEVISRLKPASETHIVVLSMHADEPYIIEALRFGVSGYVLKNSGSSELFLAIRTAASGGQYIDPALRAKALSATIKRVLPGTVTSLTQRELQVLELAAQGKTSLEIANAISISRRTAEAHRASFMKKLALKTQTDLVLYAVRTGIVSP